MVCLISILLIWAYLKWVVKAKCEIDLDQIIKDWPGRYDVDLFDEDKINGALQTLPKNDRKCISLKLQEKIKITEDTFIFRFAIPSNKLFGL